MASRATFALNAAEQRLGLVRRISPWSIAKAWQTIRMPKANPDGQAFGVDCPRSCTHRGIMRCGTMDPPTAEQTLFGGPAKAVSARPGASRDVWLLFRSRVPRSSLSAVPTVPASGRRSMARLRGLSPKVPYLASDKRRVFASAPPGSHRQAATCPVSSTQHGWQPLRRRQAERRNAAECAWPGPTRDHRP